MVRAVTDVLLVARYELGEGLRTRLFQVAVLAYLGGVGAANWLLVKILVELERSLAEGMGVPPTERPGAMMAQLTRNGDIAEVLRPLLGSKDAALALLGTPPMALWSAGAAMALLPVVLLFTGSGSVAAEVKSRSLRYLLVRTGRLRIALGKALGQALLAAVAAALGVGLTVAMAATMMVEVPMGPLLAGLAARHGMALVYGLPWLGVALGASMLVGNPNGARLLAGAAFVGAPIAAWQLEEVSGPDALGRLADLARLLLPSTLWGELWSPEPGAPAIAAARAGILAVAAFATGAVRFERRDL